VATLDPQEAPNDFGGFYRRTLAPLRRYLARLIGCQSEAQDLAHDAYARVFPAITGERVHAPQAFLYLTARRLAINRIRHRELAATRTVDIATLRKTAANAPTVQQTVMARQELAQLERALASLPPRCRAVLLLRRVEMLSPDEVARRLGITRSTVEKQHVRAVRLLRLALASPPAQSPDTPEADVKSYFPPLGENP
jgi:RNA polymerase sigma-70 factor (ECF subfamily)